MRFFLLFLVFLSGCISLPNSSPVPRFYSLESLNPDPEMIPKQQDKMNGVLLGLGPVSIPEYCNRPQIVTKDKEGAFSYAQFERWSEPLADALGRTIMLNTLKLLPKANVVLFPWPGSLPVKFQVILRIVELECRLADEVKMTVQWLVIQSGSSRVLSSNLKTYKQQLDGSNYPALTKGMSRICLLLSSDIAQDLVKILDDSKVISQPR